MEGTFGSYRSGFHPKRLLGDTPRDLFQWHFSFRRRDFQLIFFLVCSFGVSLNLFFWRRSSMSFGQISTTLSERSYIPEQIHLSLINAQTMGVSWVTQGPGASVVEWSTTPGGPYESANGYSEDFIDPVTGRTFKLHFANMTDISQVPHLRYYYRCGDPPNWSQEFSFRSVPSDGSLQKFIFLGDLGLDNARAFPKILNDVNSQHFDMAFHVGDMGYEMEDNSSTIGDYFMNMIQPIASQIPYQTCPGNHEANRKMFAFATFYNYMMRFNMPGRRSDMFYSFDIGLVHFISINTESYFFFPSVFYIYEQIRWLKQDLIAANQNRFKTPWIVVYGHRPLYCSNINNGADCGFEASWLRNSFGWGWGLEDLFINYKVDLYIAGHEHSYERLYPIANGQVTSKSYVNPNAPVYVVDGAAGNKEELEWGGFNSTAPFSAFHRTGYGYSHLYVHNFTHLEWRHLDDNISNENPVDTLWIIKETDFTMDASSADILNFSLFVFLCELVLLIN